MTKRSTKTTNDALAALRAKKAERQRAYRARKAAKQRWEHIPTAVPIPYDPVNSPKHYTSHPSGVECIEITEWMNFNRGNVVKYIWRADEKGEVLGNLKKARWYLDREISRLEKEQRQTNGSL